MKIEIFGLILLSLLLENSNAVLVNVANVFGNRRCEGAPRKVLLAEANKCFNTGLFKALWDNGRSVEVGCGSVKVFTNSDTCENTPTLQLNVNQDKCDPFLLRSVKFGCEDLDVINLSFRNGICSSDEKIAYSIPVIAGVCQPIFGFQVDFSKLSAAHIPQPGKSFLIVRNGDGITASLFNNPDCEGTATAIFNSDTDGGCANNIGRPGMSIFCHGRKATKSPKSTVDVVQTNTPTLATKAPVTEPVSEPVTEPVSEPVPEPEAQPALVADNTAAIVGGLGGTLAILGAAAFAYKRRPVKREFYDQSEQQMSVMNGQFSNSAANPVFLMPNSTLNPSFQSV